MLLLLLRHFSFPLWLTGLLPFIIVRVQMWHNLAASHRVPFIEEVVKDVNQPVILRDVFP